MMRSLKQLCVAFSLAALACLANAQLAIPSDGSDGVFNPTSSITIDLSQAVTAPWSNPSPIPGNGIYDKDKWAIVFKYQSVNIPAGVTVTFKNHPANPPVVWLVNGDCTISGTVNLNGRNGYETNNGSIATPGPGGFRGGAGQTGIIGSGGFGPGGGHYKSGNASFGYANPQLLPLIGGSGGAGSENYGIIDGGAGGGAILIAAKNSLSLNGSIQVVGGLASVGGSRGSGGAIRLIADSFLGNGNLIGAPSGGELGRIRVETNQSSFTGQTQGLASGGVPIPLLIWPPANTPTIKIASIGGTAVPDAPTGQFTFPFGDLQIQKLASADVILQTTNVPLTWNVYVRVVPRNGQDFTVTATLVSGNVNAATWKATITPVPAAFSAVQARAAKP